ncbi:glycosyltransferase family 2 protein [Kitasatospora sp. NPDC057015]|uniref:glycosyltransferase family 2 protein n=1 Tax=Kitasatospora sp. NPDC057015 TaxID=3346001 RepID=UPI00363F9010
MPSPLISVVLPAYDQQKQLSDCLESLLSQSLHDFEVILVADRSRETAADLADAYAARHADVSVLHLSAAVGVGRARNAGAALAHGRYLLFLDSDHTMPPDAFHSLAERLEETGEVDVLQFGHTRRHGGRDWPGGAQHLLDTATPAVLGPQERPELFGAPPVVWDKLLNRTRWTDRASAFPDGHYQEVPVVHQALLDARRIAVLPRECVQLRRRHTLHPTGSPGSSHFDVFAQYERSFELLDARPELEAVRPHLFTRMIRQYLFVLELAGCVARAERPQFFQRAAEHHRRFLPAGHRRPAGREGMKFALLAGGSYPAFELAKLSHIARTAVTGRAGLRGTPEPAR